LIDITHLSSGNIPLPSSDDAADAAEIQHAVMTALVPFGSIAALDLNLKRGFGFVTFEAGADVDKCLG
jgi:hypothetical protein